MNNEIFSEIEQLSSNDGAAAAIDKVVETLRSEKEYFSLFDALLLQKKHSMGLPVAQPTSLDDVPEEQRDEFEEAYVDAAREVGELLLADGKIPQAWPYFRTIRETEKVRAALDALDTRREADEETEALIGVALYEGAHPVKGLEMMLRTHGTCNTVTAMDQQMQQLPPDDQKQASALLVRELYSDLCSVLNQEVQQRVAMTPPSDSLRELITGRDWLFDEANYHIDVSHLNAIVRFARAMDASCPDLAKVIELAEYGTHLDEQFQYGGDAPFDDFYPAHVQFLKAIADDGRDEALAYFKEKLEAEPDHEDKQLIAYVLVDLLTRCGKLAEALEVAEPYLTDVEEASGFSFARLCRDADRLDTLQKVTRAKGDLVGYAAALV
jgi:hypothetical protein